MVNGITTVYQNIWEVDVTPPLECQKIAEAFVS